MFKKFKALETGLAAYALYWGLLLLLPYHTFSVSAYSGMAAVADEIYWGAFALSVGVSQMYGMLFCSNPKVKGFFLLVAAGFWYFVFSMFMIGNPFTTGGTYIITAILCSYLFVKVGEQHGR
jgi:hypothetical protein